MRTKKGFTLVELLVVIAIIALLMSVLMPALAKVKKQAMAVMCLGNFRQWHVIFSQYCGDYDDGFMNGWINQAADNGFGGWDTWVGIEKYYVDVKLLLCPIAVKLESEGGVSPFTAWDGDTYDMDPSSDTDALKGKRGSYAINWWVTNPYNHSTNSYRVSPDNWKTRNVSNSSQIPVLTECGAVWRVSPQNGDSQPLYDGDGSFDPVCMTKRVTINRHDSGFTQMLFMDGSVRKVGLKELRTLRWHRSYKIDGIWTLAGGARPGDWAAVGADWMEPFKMY